jgi:uncharacterized membrane protein YraQ (UPF0718 family)
MIKPFADWLVYNVIGFAKNEHLAEALNFFVYDVIKIFLLLSAMIFCVSIIRSFFPPAKVRKILSHKVKYLGNIIAALFGIVTPFCSCSAVALFLGFVRAGVPLGTTFSFLVAAPMVNEVALVMLFGIFGWKIAFIYAVSGVCIAVISGILIEKMRVERLLESIVFENKGEIYDLSVALRWQERFVYAKEYTKNIVKKVWLYIVLGIGVGAWIHGYIPADFFAKYASADKWYAVPLATIIGVPIYSNAAGVIPFVSVLTEKGVAIGTTLAFMMAVTGLSLPEFMILKSVMKIRLIMIFAGIVAAGIIFTGYLFNFLLK